jgi:hypothetical protein
MTASNTFVRYYSYRRKKENADIDIYRIVMSNLNNNHLSILELPDEILCLIIGKLNTFDVFYSLVNVNQQFNRLVFDSLYVHDLNMGTIMNINSWYDQASSIDPEVLSSICKKILPRIHSHVHKLTVAEYSMKQVLLAANYPQLYSLSLIDFQAETLYEHLTGVVFNFVHQNKSLLIFVFISI